MELNVHIDLCEALLEDFLIQFQNPLLLQDAVALEGLFMAAESLLSYLVHIESFTSADSRPTSIRHSLGSAIDATIEMAQLLASRNSRGLVSVLGTLCSLGKLT